MKYTFLSVVVLITAPQGFSWGMNPVYDWALSTYDKMPSSTEEAVMGLHQNVVNPFYTDVIRPVYESASKAASAAYSLTG